MTNMSLEVEEDANAFEQIKQVRSYVYRLAALPRTNQNLQQLQWSLAGDEYPERMWIVARSRPNSKLLQGRGNWS